MPVVVLTGEAVRFGPDGEPSAMAKRVREAPQQLGYLGFTEDQQGDLSVHGGPDKAVHHYPHDHYAWWVAMLGAHPLLDTPGAFGENISTSGLTEDTVCIGDRYRLGTAVVEVSQGRQPCWKLNHHFGRPDIASSVVRSRRSGWYYRVIEPGTVAPDAAMTLIDRNHAQWPVARVFSLLIGGGHRAEPAAVRMLMHLPSLADNWRTRARKLVD